ncbi:class I SAM-dependent methyltransferase [bacterium]|nr:class I SAM-dependent methyltransferase [bacterium]
MKEWEKLEIDYAGKLKSCPAAQRKQLYTEAYNAVSKLRMSLMPDDPEKRTAGTSRALVNLLVRLCRPCDTVLEVGCGRGYTCLGLAKRVKEIIGIDVSDPVLEETLKLLEREQIINVRILKASGDELSDNFEEGQFDKVISIDVYEHLHPEDGLNHLKQVHTILKPDGSYLCVAACKINGPHDVTRNLFPDSEEPMGFHLNEISCEEFTHIAREIGYSRFHAIRYFTFKSALLFHIKYPALLQIYIEKICQKICKSLLLKRICGRLFLSRVIWVVKK